MPIRFIDENDWPHNLSTYRMVQSFARIVEKKTTSMGAYTRVTGEWYRFGGNYLNTVGSNTLWYKDNQPGKERKNLVRVRV